MTCIRLRAPHSSSELVERVMRANVGRETSPEFVLRTSLTQAGLKFETAVRPEQGIRCRADFVFRPEMVCVFVDGCYWHACPTHFSVPRTNTSWWREKIDANRDRDQRQTAVLRAHGWSVLRVWEHDLRASQIPVVIRAIRSRLRRRCTKSSRHFGVPANPPLQR